MKNIQRGQSYKRFFVVERGHLFRPGRVNSLCWLDFRGLPYCVSSSLDSVDALKSDVVALKIVVVVQRRLNETKALNFLICHFIQGWLLGHVCLGRPIMKLYNRVEFRPLSAKPVHCPFGFNMFGDYRTGLG